jgi:hypothetical protein
MENKCCDWLSERVKGPSEYKFVSIKIPKENDIKGIGIQIDFDICLGCGRLRPLPKKEV